MSPKETDRLSRLLSLVLRHEPEKLGLTLDEAGWTSTDALLEALARHGRSATFDNLRHVVETNDKKRFAFNEDLTRIRANQGHSIEVALGYEPTTPPEILLHGTAPQFLASIRSDGLRKGQRHDVHLSASLETAQKVGQRRGNAVILKVRAGDMHRAGHAFQLSANGVWLTDFVPPEFIEFPA